MADEEWGPSRAPVASAVPFQETPAAYLQPLDEIRDPARSAQDLRAFRTRLVASERALHEAQATAARTPMLQAMLKDAEAEITQGRAARLADAAALAAARRSLEAVENRGAEQASMAAGLAEQVSALEARLALAQQRLNAVETEHRVLLEERAVILKSTSWRLTAAPRRVLSWLRRR